MQTENGDGRNELVERYRSYAHALAAEFIRNVPAQVEKDDVIGYAELGLVEAAAHFDPTAGAQFKTFSYYRIRGAIYDGLRKLGGLPRDFYRQLRADAAANAYLEDYSIQVTRTPPNSQYDELKNICGNVLSTYLLSLDAVGADPASAIDAGPDRSFQTNELAHQVRQAVAKLPEKNRRVINDYYFNDRSLEEIGRDLGLSKSWVCRIHARSVEMLRGMLTSTTNLKTPDATLSGFAR